ncbi:MAG: DUF1003 domain-containing protein [Polyangiaceae bacterium]
MEARLPEAQKVNENVTALASLRARTERNIGRHQRAIEHVTAQLGRPRSLWVIAVTVVVWMGWNLVAIRLGARPFDPPPFAWLQGLVGLGALLMTSMILTTQNRQTRDFDRIGQLELQVNLLAEQKIAKLIALIEELRRDMPTVTNRVDPVADVMQEPVDPHAVLSALEETTVEKKAP